MYSIYPNPFTALDAGGRPCGRTYVDPSHPRPFEILGGKLRRQIVPHEGEDTPDYQKVADLDVRDVRVRVIADVVLRPIQVVPSQYLRERITSGDAVAADRATAVACGISAAEFRDPIDVLSEALAACLVRWRANHDPDDEPAIAGHVLTAAGQELKVVKATAPRPSPLPLKVFVELQRLPLFALRKALEPRKAPIEKYLGAPLAKLGPGALTLWLAEAAPPRGMTPTSVEALAIGSLPAVPAEAPAAAPSAPSTSASAAEAAPAASEPAAATS